MEGYNYKIFYVTLELTMKKKNYNRYTKDKEKGDTTQCHQIVKTVSKKERDKIATRQKRKQLKKIV